MLCLLVSVLNVVSMVSTSRPETLLLFLLSARSIRRGFLRACSMQIDSWFRGSTAPVRAGRRAAAAFPRRAARRDGAAGAFAFEDFRPGQSSWLARRGNCCSNAARPSTSPCRARMAWKRAASRRPGLDELEEAGFVLGAAGLERDGGEMFGGENAGWLAFHLFLHGLPPAPPRPAGRWAGEIAPASRP